MRRTYHLVPLLMLLTACASGSAPRPGSMPRPDIAVRQTGPLFFGSGNTAPVSLEVFIRNNGDMPMVVRQIRLESPAMVQYTIGSLSRTFRETIAPGATVSLPMFATAYSRTTRFSPTEPLTLRVVAQFEAGGGRFQEVTSVQVQESF